MTLETIEELATTVSSTGIVLAGFVFVALVVFYQSAPEIFDIYIDISNGDYELFDSNVSIIERFAWYEIVLIVLSLYHQYTVIAPETGAQSLVSSLTYIILFTVFVSFMVKSYLLEPKND